MLDSLTNKQRKIVLTLAIIIAVIVMYIIYQNAENKNNIGFDEEILVSENSTKYDSTKGKKEENLEVLEKIVVHIAGAVNSPGVVSLEEGERIQDAINLAGGLTENADISNVNLAYILEDGVKIIIPEKGAEINKDSKIINEGAGDNIVLNEDSKFSNNRTTLVNINKATQEELEQLSGVGPSLASKIIEYRKVNGNFFNIEDIKNVSGIGENKFEAIKDYIFID